MNYLNYCFIFICMSLFISCDKGNNVDVPDPEPWYMGYFEGTINGIPVSIKNTGDTDRPIKPYTYIIHPDGIEEYGWAVPVNDLWLDIMLTPLTEGQHTITNGDIANGIEYSHIIKDMNKETEKIYYPDKESFNITIKSKKFKPNSAFPYLEGTMSGIFCNINDPNDQITLKDVKFGIH